MPFISDSANTQLYWHRPLLMAVRILVGLSLALMVFLLTRLPVEDLLLAMDRFSVRHDELQHLDRGFGDLPAQGGLEPLHARMRTLADTRCSIPAQADADAARLAQLRELADTYPRLAGPQAEASMARAREQLREL